MFQQFELNRYKHVDHKKVNIIVQNSISGNMDIEDAEETVATIKA